MEGVKPYLKQHFSLRHRLTASVSNLLGGITYTVRHGLIKGMKRRGGLGFLPAFLTPASEKTPEFRFMTNLSLRNAVVYELGAFEGIFTLYFSKWAKHVVAYEPNPRSYARLLENLRLNNVGNVVVRNAAVGDQNGSITLFFDKTMMGAASGDASVGAQIAATSANVGSVDVHAVRLDDEVAGQALPAPDFVKIDIEGMELAALRGMEETLRHHRPALYIEVHGATWGKKEENVRRVVTFL